MLERRSLSPLKGRAPSPAPKRRGRPKKTPVVPTPQPTARGRRVRRLGGLINSGSMYPVPQTKPLTPAALRLLKRNSMDDTDPLQAAGCSSFLPVSTEFIKNATDGQRCPTCAASLTRYPVAVMRGAQATLRYYCEPCEQEFGQRTSGNVGDKGSSRPVLSTLLSSAPVGGGGTIAQSSNMAAWAGIQHPRPRSMYRAQKATLGHMTTVAKESCAQAFEDYAAWYRHQHDIPESDSVDLPASFDGRWDKIRNAGNGVGTWVAGCAFTWQGRVYESPPVIAYVTVTRTHVRETNGVVQIIVEGDDMGIASNKYESLSATRAIEPGGPVHDRCKQHNCRLVATIDGDQKLKSIFAGNSNIAHVVRGAWHLNKNAKKKFIASRFPKHAEHVVKYMNTIRKTMREAGEDDPDGAKFLTHYFAMALHFAGCHADCLGDKCRHQGYVVPEALRLEGRDQYEAFLGVLALCVRDKDCQVGEASDSSVETINRCYLRFMSKKTIQSVTARDRTGSCIASRNMETAEVSGQWRRLAGVRPPSQADVKTMALLDSRRQRWRRQTGAGESFDERDERATKRKANRRQHTPQLAQEDGVSHTAHVTKTEVLRFPCPVTDCIHKRDINPYARMSAADKHIENKHPQLLLSGDIQCYKLKVIQDAEAQTTEWPCLSAGCNKVFERMKKCNEHMELEHAREMDAGAIEAYTAKLNLALRYMTPAAQTMLKELPSQAPTSTALPGAVQRRKDADTCARHRRVAKAKQLVEKREAAAAERAANRQQKQQERATALAAKQAERARLKEEKAAAKAAVLAKKEAERSRLKEAKKQQQQQILNIKAKYAPSTRKQAVGDWVQCEGGECDQWWNISRPWEDDITTFTCVFFGRKCKTK